MQTVEIRNNEYSVPGISIPKKDGTGDAYFPDTSDATLNSANQLPEGVTAYAGGQKYTGTKPVNDSTDVTVSGAAVTVPAGIYESQVQKSVASGSATAPASISGTGATVSAGNNELTLTKDVSVTPAVQEGYVESGTAGTSAVSLKASVATKAAATITPGTSDVEIPENTYLTGKQTVKGDINLVPGKIVYPYEIFGVAGTAQLPVIEQDSQTGILRIS